MLEKQNSKQKEIAYLKSHLDFLLEISYPTFYYGNVNHLLIIEYLCKSGKLSFSNLEENIKNKYGWTDDENDKELIIVKILFIFNIFNIFFLIERITSKNLWSIKKRSIQNDLNNHLLDYKINWKNYTFEPTEQKTIIDNIQNIEISIAEKIKKLLKSLTNEDEIWGIITKLSNDIELLENSEDKKIIFEKLNCDEKALFKTTKNLCNFLANKKFRHPDTTLRNLNFRDLSHNFALSCSLLFKIIEINS